MGIEVRVFGPMEIRFGDRTVQVGSRRQQVLLALLVTGRGDVVPVPTLTDAMWPADPPASPRKSLQLHVRRLRQALGDARAVPYRVSGYVLAVPGTSVDVHRFEELAQRGRAALVSGDEATAAELLRQVGRLPRGPAFPGLADVDGLAIEARRLDELRLAALEDRIAAELALGEPAAVVPELTALVAEHPLRERFRAQLMTALHRAGRKAEALATYHEGRRALVEELGLEPGVECRELARAIEADDPAVLRPATGPPGLAAGAGRTAGAGAADRRVPRQLPADVPGFTGRTEQLRALDRLLRPARDGRAGAGPAGPAIGTVEGMAGVGKTALAVHWGHRVAGRFPDGQLYLNLHGPAAGGPLAPQQALARFLRAFGVPDEQVPADLAQAVAAYRGQLAGRRVLVLLDNAAGPAQVRPLLPGEAGCAVLVTSRDRLGALTRPDGAGPDGAGFDGAGPDGAGSERAGAGPGGAGRLVLGPLPPGEARSLLAQVLGTARVDAEPDAVTELVERCGRLPLALRIAAANLAARPGHPVAEVVAQLRGADKLAALAVAGDDQAAVAAAFDMSYRRLPGPARRVFRLLGLVPGPDLPLEAAAALAGTAPEQARAQLAVLAAAHLVEEPAPGRYGCHDLLRAYAADRVRDEEAPAARDAARERLYAYYVLSADAARRLLNPEGVRPPWTGGVTPASFDDPEAALGWLDAEWSNLAAIAHQAATGPHPAAWKLANALRPYIYRRGQLTDGAAIAEAGAAAAEAAGDPDGQGWALLGLAGMRFWLGDAAPAIAAFTRARDCFRTADRPDGEGAALSDLGTAHSELGQFDLALECYSEALPVFERMASPFGQAVVFVNLAELLVRRGRLAEALDHARRGTTAFTEIGSDLGVAGSLTTLGDIHYLRGELGPATGCFTQAQAYHRATGDRGGEGEAWSRLADVYCEAGRPAEARGLASAALLVARESGHREREAGALRTLARALGPGGAPAAAEQEGERALVLARRIGNRYLEVAALVEHATRRLAGGGVAGARTAADQAVESAREAGFRLLEGQAVAASAGAALAAGDLARALAGGERALAIHRETGHRPGEARVHALLGSARRRAGDPAAAEGHRERAARLAGELGMPVP